MFRWAYFSSSIGALNVAARPTIERLTLCRRRLRTVDSEVRNEIQSEVQNEVQNEVHSMKSSMKSSRRSIVKPRASPDAFYSWSLSFIWSPFGGLLPQARLYPVTNWTLKLLSQNVYWSNSIGASSDLLLSDSLPI